MDFQFDLNNLVQFTPRSKAYCIVWRAQVRRRQPDGSYQRYNVYLLDDGFWDCYHENELHAAWQW